MPDIANLFSALVKAGVVPGTTGPNVAKTEETSAPVDPAREAARAYRQFIRSHKVKLTSSEITRYVRDPIYLTFSLNFRSRQRAPIVEMLYNRLPTQCKQCSARFADSPAGKKQFEDHLDMHFRQNRKASQAVGRGHSRSWFITMEVCMFLVSA